MTQAILSQIASELELTYDSTVYDRLTDTAPIA